MTVLRTAHLVSKNRADFCNLYRVNGAHEAKTGYCEAPTCKKRHPHRYALYARSVPNFFKLLVLSFGWLVPMADTGCVTVAPQPLTWLAKIFDFCNLA